MIKDLYNDKIVLYPSKKRLKYVVTTINGGFMIMIVSQKNNGKYGVLIVTEYDKIVEYRYIGKVKKLKKLADKLIEILREDNKNE